MSLQPTKPIPHTSSQGISLEDSKLSHLYLNEDGEIVHIPKSPAEVVGEQVLRPLIDKVAHVASTIISSNPFSSVLEYCYFPPLLPMASAAPVDGSCDASGSCVSNTELSFRNWRNIDRNELVLLRDSNGQTLLQAAILSGDKESAWDLIEAFKDSDALHHTDSEGKNALHLAATEGHHELVPRLLAIPLDKKDSDGFTPLHYALRQGQTEVVKELAKNGASLVEPWVLPSGEEIFPLYMAIAGGNPDALDTLFEADAFKEMNLMQAMPKIGTALHVAIQTNQAPMLKYLLQQKHIETKHLLQQKDPYGQTPLMLAANLGDLNAINLLNDQNVYLDQGDGERGGTAVHHAAKGGQPKAIQLLDYLGASLTAIDASGNTPLGLIKENQGPKARECEALLQRLPRIKKANKTKPPNFKRRPPINLVFQGGGPKGIAYVGAIKELESLDALKEVKRVAGTSAGAITSGLLAVGYGADELEELLGRDFMELLDHKGDLEKSFADLAENPTKAQGVKTLLSNYWDGWTTLVHPIKRAKKFKEELFGMTGLCNGEELRIWLDDLIAEKTGIKNCTFEELEDLVHKFPKKYKELHIFSLNLNTQGSDLVRFSHEDPKFKDLIIADAIRASLSIPGVFEPHILHFKDAAGLRHPRSGHGQFIDGGLVKNFPLDAFDDERFQEDKYNYGEKTNRRTLGIKLKEVGEAPIPSSIQPVESGKELLKAVLSTYFHAEEILSREKAHNQDRTVTIPVNIGMLDFDVDQETKQEMIQNGTKAVDFFLTAKK